MFSFAAILLLVLLAPLMTFNSTGEAGDGSPIRQWLYLALFGALIFGVRPLSDPSRLVVIPLPIVVTLAWCWISLAWSIDPGIGVRRLVLTTAMIWAIFVAVRQLTFDQTVTLIRILLVGVLIANWIAIFIAPDFAIHQISTEANKKLAGDWRGIMMNKNIAGALCGVTILFFIFSADRLHWAFRAPVILAAGVFLYFSQSKTSGIMMLGALLIGYLFNYFKSNYRMLVIALLFLAFAAISVAVIAYRDPLKGNFTDPTAFTGRMQIWTMLLKYAADTNYIGAGFGSFWYTPQSPVFSYSSSWVTTLASGHSGYLDLLVTIGAVGLVLAVFAMIIWPSYRLLKLPIGAATNGALPLSILFFAAGHNATETSIFDRDVLMNIFMLIAIALIQRIVVRAGQPRGSMPERPRNVAPVKTASSEDLWGNLR